MHRQSPQTRRESDSPTIARRPQPGPVTPEQRHRQRYMQSLGRFVDRMQALSRMLQHRFRSEEASETIDAHLSMIEEARNPASARDILGHIIEERVLGTIKPPQLEIRVDAALKALFDAALLASDWPALLITVSEQLSGMADPYDSGKGDITRLPTGSYVIVIGESYQGATALPAASHSNVVASPSEPPQTSKRVRRSPTGNVSNSALEIGITA